MEANKLLVDYKTDIEIMKEQIRTMHLKLEEVVYEVYKNLAPRIESSVSVLGVEIAKAKLESTKLQVQVDALSQEKAKIAEVIIKYHQRLEVLEDLIGG